MADLHTLPRSALPEGWRAVFDGYEREVDRAVALRVQMLLPGYWRAQINSAPVEVCTSAREAMAAAEVAYCGCRVRVVASRATFDPPEG